MSALQKDDERRHGVDEFVLNELKDRYDMLVLDELAVASVSEVSK